MSAANASAQNKKSYLIPIIIIGVLFFVFGFVTWVNSTLISYFENVLELTKSEALWVTFAFYISYAVMAFPSSWILNKVGFKTGMMLGLIVMALGALVFIPAANTKLFSMFLTGLFIQGTGLALLQTASNPYVTILGPIEGAARRMSIMGICNKGAGAIAPLIMGAVMLKDMDLVASQDDLIARVILPYIIMAVVLIVLAIAIRFSALPDIESEEDTNKEHVAGTKDRPHWWNYPYLLIGFVAMFLYVGVEVVAGDTIISYGDSLGIDLNIAKNFTTYTMIGMLVGYLLGILLIPKYLKQENALKISAVLGILFSVCAIFTDGYTSITFIALLGFANAAIYPAIWPLAVDGLGKHLKVGAALLIVGLSGGAIVPQLWAIIGDAIHDHRAAYWILVPCYLFIFYFAAKGHKAGKDLHIIEHSK